ncbi:MAG: hypothetical protein K8R36_09530 [Planctomycetales bacterium]|nr:hypothetical protein [Planctomycetales bacterium]
MAVPHRLRHSSCFCSPLRPARRQPLLRTELRQTTYPDGYMIEYVGPVNAE